MHYSVENDGLSLEIMSPLYQDTCFLLKTRSYGMFINAPVSRMPVKHLFMCYIQYSGVYYPSKC